MDPDTCLGRIRSLVVAMHGGDEAGIDDDSTTSELGEEIAAQFAALDGWLSSGGFPPRAWGNVPIVHRRQA